MSYQTILFEISGGIARLTFNRPERLNSFNTEMHSEVRTAPWPPQRQQLTPACSSSPARGAGSAPARTSMTVPWRPAARRRPRGQSIEKYYKPLVLALRSLPLPVIAAVNGVAAGAGANLALACDLVIAARSASFVQAFAKLGLIPGFRWDVVPAAAWWATRVPSAWHSWARSSRRAGGRLGTDLALRRGRGAARRSRGARAAVCRGTDPGTCAHQAGDLRGADARAAGAAGHRARLPGRARPLRGLRRRACAAFSAEAYAALHRTLSMMRQRNGRAEPRRAGGRRHVRARPRLAGDSACSCSRSAGRGGRASRCACARIW